jgi:hypothetical protein
VFLLIKLTSINSYPKKKLERLDFRSLCEIATAETNKVIEHSARDDIVAVYYGESFGV